VATSPSQSAWIPTSQLSLQELCLRIICRNINSGNVLELLQFADHLSLPSTSHDIRTVCMRYVMHAYRTLRERRTFEELSQVLPPNLIRDLEQAKEEASRWSATKVAVLGRIVESSPPPPEASERLSIPSVSGESHSYCYAALVTGVQWPQDVEPSQREAYMCEEEFGRIVGMSYTQFSALPAWRKSRLKQDLKLF